MKFSDIDNVSWATLQKYLDTCVLPLTGLDGTETPPEATGKLELLRDALDLLDKPFKGRIVVYPACHFVETEQEIDALCGRLKAQGFQFVVLVAVDGKLAGLNAGAADLLLLYEQDSTTDFSGEVLRMWEQARGGAER